MDGPTVVISPLIALQKDQVDSLQSHDAGGAALVNSQTRAGDKKDALSDLEKGHLEFIFVTPEQLAKPEILEHIKDAKPSLFVVDEAHCLSEWGHDFRPEFLKLGAAIEALGHPRILALTATASRPVSEEIAARLGMREPNIIVKGFDRPNICLRVEPFQTESQKEDSLLRRIGWADGSGVIYVSSRSHAEKLAQAISERDIRAMHYHGGMPAKARHFVQDEFMAGRIPVIVATSAFGMGIDKPDSRFVYHYDIPHSVDSYYQEIGRAGRDGEPAQAILFFRPEDLNIHKFFAGGGKLATEKLERVARAIQQTDAPLTPKQIAEETKLSKAKVTKAIQRLEDAGAIQENADGTVAVAESSPSIEEAAHLADQDETRRHEAELLRIGQIRGYAELLSCRRAYILNYFGEEGSAECGNCDNCTGRGAGIGKAAGSGTRREVV